MIVCDTGPLVAAADRDDADNRPCTDLFTGRVDTYADFPFGTTDAAVAERLKLAEVATLDHRHFRAVRPRHISAFTLLQ